MFRRRSKKPPRPHHVVPWFASLAVHLPIAVIAAVILTLVKQSVDNQERHVVVVPVAFKDEHSQHRGLGSGGEVSHPTLGNIGVNSLGGGGVNASSLMNAGPLGNTLGSGPVTPGMPSGGASIGGTPVGSGFDVNFFEHYAKGSKVVYILDHSGSMIDNFDFLKHEAVRSVRALTGMQSFAVIMVSDKATTVGPLQLQPALPPAKDEFARLVEKEVAEGSNDGLLEPFQQAFAKAFQLDPDVIYFLTDGKFGDGLIPKVREMNKDRHTSVETIAFVTEEPQYRAALLQLAQENGGHYTFMPQRELGH